MAADRDADGRIGVKHCGDFKVMGWVVFVISQRSESGRVLLELKKIKSKIEGHLRLGLLVLEEH